MAKTVSCREGETGAKARRAAVAAPDHPDEVWKRFRRSRSAQSREELIEQYMPLVRAVSARLAAELPNSVDPDDLISAGTFGLMDAIERFDPKLGTRFETYCSVRIRGSILDELRQLNWVPRMQCTRAAKVNMAIAALRGELGRTPTPREIARKAGLKVRDVENVSKGANKQVSLTSSPDRHDEGVRHIDVLQAAGHLDPAALIQQKEQRDILDREVRKLPTPERLLVILYYFEELTMKQVGEVLNVTESRVCQMHAEVLSLLQQRLAELDEAGAESD